MALKDGYVIFTMQCSDVIQLCSKSWAYNIILIDPIAFTFKGSKVFGLKSYFSFMIEECSTYMMIHPVKKLEVITVQVVFLRCSGLCLCLCGLKKHDLDVKHVLEPTHNSLGLHEVLIQHASVNSRVR